MQLKGGTEIKRRNIERGGIVYDNSLWLNEIVKNVDERAIT